jgi:subtilase family serine protease
MGRVTLRRLAVAVGGTGVVVALAASTAIAGHDRHVLPGGKPDWTAAAPQTAVVPASQQVSAKVWLAPRNAAQLTALAQSVSDPTSSQYQQFITPDQYTAQFAPTAAQVAAVTAWLKGSGLQIDQVGPEGHYLAVSGSAAAINAAFGTQLARFAVNGKQVQAPAVDVSVPDSVATSVLTVTGLSNLGHMVTPGDLGAPAGFVNGTPCSSYYGQQKATTLPKFNGATLPYAPCGYVPSQLRGAYGISSGGQGDGQQGNGQQGNQGDGGKQDGNAPTVAITDAFDASTLLSDANRYATLHGDRAFSSKQFGDRSVPDSTVGTRVADCGGNGWYGEQTLDVEAVHGMSPSANVLYYGAASCYDDDLLAQLSQVVHDNKASIVTNSWGEPTFVMVGTHLFSTIDQGLIDAYESVFKQGAVQGIGFYFSSGDNGDELAAFGFAHPDWPTGDPWVTSVGGTSLAVGRENNRIFETGWGTTRYNQTADGTGWSFLTFLYGAGGGFSQVFSRPWYQNGVVPATTTGRAVPDIGLDADPTTGMLIGETQTFALDSRYGPAGVHYGEFRIGGTSLASPLMAGFTAVAQQAMGGRRIGFANPYIYSLARSRGAYYDVTPQGDAGNVRADFKNGYNETGGLRYTVRTFNQDSSLTTGRGWDDVTGVGSPNLDSYVRGGRH